MKAAVALLVLALAAPAGAHEQHAERPPAPAAAAPLFEPPAPGTYELPPIGRVREHVLLDADGRPARLPVSGPGRVSVVAFVYAGCGQSCPLALATLQALDRALAAQQALHGRVELVTVSFDPVRDPPKRMRALREAFAPRSDWRFLTAAGPEALAPVLADYGQRVTALVDAEGSDTGVLQHVLKVFLVDERLWIRNVYSVGLMDPRLVLNDVRTLLLD